MALSVICFAVFLNRNFGKLALSAALAPSCQAVGTAHPLLVTTGAMIIISGPLSTSITLSVRGTIPYGGCGYTKSEALHDIRDQAVIQDVFGIRS